MDLSPPRTGRGPPRESSPCAGWRERSERPAPAGISGTGCFRGGEDGEGLGLPRSFFPARAPRSEPASAGNLGDRLLSRGGDGEGLGLPRGLSPARAPRSEASKPASAGGAEEGSEGRVILPAVPAGGIRRAVPGPGGFPGPGRRSRMRTARTVELDFRGVEGGRSPPGEQSKEGVPERGGIRGLLARGKSPLQRERHGGPRRYTLARFFFGFSAPAGQDPAPGLTYRP
jgi:hypothetical protein